MSSAKNRVVELNFLRTEFRREQATNFALLRKVPSTHVRKFIDYFSTLDTTGKEALTEGLVENAHVFIYRRTEDVGRPYKDRNLAWRKYHSMLPLMGALKYASIRELR